MSHPRVNAFTQVEEIQSYFSREPTSGAFQHPARVSHAGLIRLPAVPTEARMALMAQVLERYQEALAAQAVITVRQGRIRTARPPA